MQVFTMVCVRDSAAECFGPAFCTVSRGVAIRGFIQESKNPDSQVAKKPEDFELYLIGHYHDDRGVLVPLEQGPELLMRGMDAVQS